MKELFLLRTLCSRILAIAVLPLSIELNPAIALQDYPQKTKIERPSLVRLCWNYQTEPERSHRTEALAWLESQTSPVTLTIVSAMWYGRNPDELEQTETPISAIEACSVYPNALNSQRELDLENRTQALEYWRSVIPQDTFDRFYQMWQTLLEEEP